VRRIVRSNHGRWLGPVALLLQGCPQLLDDQFSVAEPCKGPACTDERPGDEQPGDETPDAPDGGTPPPPRAKPPAMALSPGDAGASPAPGPAPGGGATAACWAIALNDSTHTTAGNCLDIHGWNRAVVDETTATTLATSYRDGKVCFAGELSTQGWGIVYNFTFADDATWNAATRGVAGIQLEVSGPTPPPKVEVIYTVNGNRDFCRELQPVTNATVPFSSTHPDCATGPAGDVPDNTALTHLRLHIPVSSTTRAFDFCLGLRAAP
jgi:hypothetical protein